MQSTADHLDLAPPPPGRWHGPMGQAVVVHVLLIAALTWGVSWQHDADTPAVEAELWSRVPVQAAPHIARQCGVPARPISTALRISACRERRCRPCGRHAC